ncbi:MAG: nickel pincer cofactor biosynthesis protein LarB [Candidatus Firestonebacteria bacterium]
MQAGDLIDLLKKVKSNKLSIKKALEKLKHFPYKNINFANVDTHRGIRLGFPEVVFCQGKTKEQIIKIVKEIVSDSGFCFATRANYEIYKSLKRVYKNIEYNKLSKTIIVGRKKSEIKKTGLVMVISAGTADMPVAEEAAITSEVTGSNVDRLYDVGVCGMHRLLNHYERIRKARVVIAVAGMEGALPSVIGGLVDKPVIAVPTSVGYGANFNGISALLTMLNSCSPNVVVVNIDNGFGAGFVASLINRLDLKRRV